MAIILPHPINSNEIRVLQEFRRLARETLSMTELEAIKHPAGGSVRPTLSLVDKGYLTAGTDEKHFTLTGKAREFLAIDSKPAG